MKVRRSSPSVKADWLTCGATALFLLLSPAIAVACQLCYEAARQLTTIGQRMDMADRVVLATPIDGGKRFRVAEIVKGEGAIGDVIADPVTGSDVVGGRDPWLLVRDLHASEWTNLGTIRSEYADWLRQLAATLLVKGERPRRAWPLTMQASFTLSDAGWRQRIAIVLPYLEDSDALVAQIAGGELARAPYAAMEVAKSQIDASTVEKWLGDPKLAPRHAAYTLLLGFAGTAADADRLEHRIESAGDSHDATNLAAMIGADLELRGPSRIGWVESKYFADHTRTMPEIEAALLALNVHGEANHTVSRERVIQAYRTFIRERPAMAGFVAQQLADWGYWDVTSEYAALLKSKTIKDPASELSVINYLQRSAAANAALQ